MKPFTLKIKTELLRRRLTVTAFAKKLKVCRVRLSYTIHGRRTYPEIRDKIAKDFGTTTERLFGKQARPQKQAA